MGRERAATPRRVSVVYFPKGGGRPKAASSGAITQTIPEIDFPPTESAPRPRPSTPRRGKEPKRRKTKELPESAHPAVAGNDKKTPQDTAELALFGHQLFEAGRLDEARVIFEGLVSTGATDAFSHTMLGTIYLARGEQDRALALFEAALQIDPKDLSALVYRGEVRLNRGKLKSAVHDFQQAVALGAADDPFVDRARRLIRMARSLARRARR